MQNSICVLSALLLTVSLTLPVAPHSQAAGSSVHIIMAREAVGHVEDERLRRLLEDNLDSLVIGAALPDGGYADNVAYGEAAHWPEFHLAYLRYVQSQCRLTLGSERCQKLIAHMMGMIAHGFEDQCYDVLLDSLSARLDPPQPDSPFLARDLMVDKYAMIDYDYALDLFPVAVSPITDLYYVFASMGYHNVTEEQLMNGEQVMIAMAALERLITNPLSDIQDSEHYSWLRHNYQDQPGGVHFTAAALAKVWNFYWRRLQGQATPADLTPVPPPGGVLEPDRNDTRGRIHIVFDRPHRRAALSGSFYLHELDTGAWISKTFFDHDGYIVSFKPKEPLTPGKRYRAYIAPDAKDFWGDAIVPEGLAWELSVRNPENEP